MFDVDDEHTHVQEVVGWCRMAGQEARAVAAEAAGRLMGWASAQAVTVAVRTGLWGRQLRSCADGLTAKPPLPEWYETEALEVDMEARAECMKRHPSQGPAEGGEQ